MTFLDDMERRIERLCLKLAPAQWTMLTQGDSDGVQALDAERGAIYGAPEALASVRAIETSGDPLLERRRGMLLAELLREAVRADPEIAAQTTRIATRMAGSRAVLNGEEIGAGALRRVLERDPDPNAREAAWRAMTATDAAVAPELLRLAELRSEQARALGFEGYYALGLAVADLPNIEALFAGLTDALGSSRRSTMPPWDAAFDAEAPPADGLPASRAATCALATFEQMGLPLDCVTLDLEPREGKSQHAWCVTVNPPADIRVSAVLVEDGPGGYDTLMHELGHAVHSRYVTGEHFLLRDTPNDALSEGVAQLFASLVWEPGWLEDMAGLDPQEAKAIAEFGKRRRARTMPWWLLRSRLERALFAGEPVTETYWRLTDELVGVRAEGEVADIPAWAQWPHLATHPVYLQNYPVAELVAAQLAEALTCRYGRWWRSKEAGEHLRRTVIAPGATVGMDDLVVAATGRPLSAESYATQWLPG